MRNVINPVKGTREFYPQEMAVGEEGRVIVGIVNHEQKEITYRVEVVINSEKNNEVELIALANEQKWEEVASFTPNRAGEKQKVEFLLYKDRETEPSLEPLILWIDVTE